MLTNVGVELVSKLKEFRVIRRRRMMYWSLIVSEIWLYTFSESKPLRSEQETENFQYIHHPFLSFTIRLAKNLAWFRTNRFPPMPPLVKLNTLSISI